MFTLLLLAAFFTLLRIALQASQQSPVPPGLALPLCWCLYLTSDSDSNSLGLGLGDGTRLD